MLVLTESLLGSKSLGLLLGLGKTGSAGLGALSAEILGGVLLLLPFLFSGGSPLLIEDGESLGNSLSDNLKKELVKRYVHH